MGAPEAKIVALRFDKDQPLIATRTITIGQNEVETLRLHEGTMAAVKTAMQDL